MAKLAAAMARTSSASRFGISQAAESFMTSNLNARDDADATQAIADGSILIHKP